MPSRCTLQRRKVSFEELNNSVMLLRKAASDTVARKAANEQEIKDCFIDKLEHIRYTAEMELTAKDLIESCPDFKLMFVPGYEIEDPVAFYEDPVVPGNLAMDLVLQDQPACSSDDDVFVQRVLILRGLNEETTTAEDRQKRLDDYLKAPRYTSTIKSKGKLAERNLSHDIGQPRTGKAQRGNDKNTDDSVWKCGSKKTRKKAVDTNTEKYTNTEKRTNTKQLNTNCRNMDSFKTLTNGSSLPTKNVSDTREKNSASEKISSEDTDLSEDKMASKKGLREHKSKTTRETSSKSQKKKQRPTRKELRPSKFYDITEIASTYNIPCEEKIRKSAELGKLRKNSSLPGKSFFSQRRDSLTKAGNGGRPVTAVKKKRTVAKPTRPYTALPDTRVKVKVV